MSEKYQVHFGVSFCRDDKTGYYLNSSIGERAHRFVWSKHNGPIPEGFHIHHIDEDKSNNDISNLEILSASDHIRMHMTERVKDPEYKRRMDENLDNIRDMTKEWHGSEEGLEWHRNMGNIVWNNTESKQYECLQCGNSFEKKTLHDLNKFCSNPCKSAYRRDQGLDDEERSCRYCSTKFMVNKYKKSVTCSRPCTNRMRKYCVDNGLEYPTLWNSTTYEQ